MTQGMTRLNLTMRRPVAEDAAELHRLIANCPPLDTNSLYCNLLHCTHFADTSVAAISKETHGEERLLGFISAYIPPGKPHTLFVWQVAVASEARGQSLAGRMLDAILERQACENVRYIDTTITPDNTASWALFRSWAARHDAPVASHLHFERQRHFQGRHDDEHLMRIGPFEMAAEAAT